jgi:hypothetical protein
MRALKIMVVVMAVLIALGTTGLVIAIARRWSSPAPSIAQLPAWVSAALDEPVGTHIVGIAAIRDQLAVQLQGGGTDRVVLIDPATGMVTGRVLLNR